MHGLKVLQSNGEQMKKVDSRRNGRQTSCVDLFGVPIAAITMEKVLAQVRDAIKTRSKLHIGVVNAAKIVNMRRDSFLRRDVLSSDIILADGMSVVWASRLVGRPLPERVAGIDLMVRMLEDGNRYGYRIYYLGAKEDVLRSVIERVSREYPNVKLAGKHNGYFSEDEEQQIAEEIAASKPDIILVAMTSPKKEKFLARWSESMGVPVCHGVGGSFDVMAGKVQRAPEIYQRLGLEWFYRFKQEPRRLWRRYLRTNMLFMGMLLPSICRYRAGLLTELYSRNHGNRP